MSRGALALTALLASGCAAARPATRVASSAPPSSAAPAPTPRDAIVLAAFPELTCPGPPFRAADEPDGTVDVIACGLRARIHEGSVEFASDSTLQPIVANAVAGTHWMFATVDGAMFAADDFLGALHRVGQTGDRWLVNGFDSTGNVATLSDEFGLWIGTPSDAFHRAPPPLDGAIVDSGFVDRSFGVAVRADGRLYRTLDGGASYVPVDLASGAAYVVYPNPSAFVIGTTQGTVRLEASGDPTPYTGPNNEFPHELGEPLLAQLDAAIWSEHPLARAAMLARGGAITDAGDVAIVLRNQLVIVRPDGQTTRLDTPGRSCEVHGWGPRLVVRCDIGDLESALFSVGEDHRWHELRRFPVGTDIVTADDGTAIVASARCDGESGDRNETPFCWYLDGSWRTRTVRHAATAIDVAGDTLLYARILNDPDADEGGEWRIGAVSRDAEDDGRPIEGGAAGRQIEMLRLTSERTVAGFAHDGSRALTVRGTIDQPLESHPLPTGALVAAFADTTHVLATGRTLADAWTSDDAGAHWSALAVPVRGDPSSEGGARRLQLPLPFGPIRCAGAVCIAGHRLLWAERGVLPAPDSFPMATAHSPAHPLDPGAEDPRSQGFGPGSVSCQRDPNAVRRAAAPAPASHRLYGVDGWLDVHRSIETPPMGGLFQLTWGGVDARGAFRANSRAATLPPIPLAAATSTSSLAPTDEGTLLLRVVTRTLLIAERCVGTTDTRQCDVLVAPRDGVPRILSSRALLDVPLTPVWLHGALALPDGGAALHFGLAFTGIESEERMIAGGDSVVEMPRVDEVVRLDRSGRIVAQRGFAWSRARTYRMLGTTAGEPGLFVATAPEPRALGFYSLAPNDDGHLAATLPARDIHPCDGSAPRPNAALVLADQFGYTTSAVFDYGRFLRVAPGGVRSLLEVEPGDEACVRSVSIWPRDPEDDQLLVNALGGIPRVVAENGAMHGEALDRGVRTLLACEF